VVNNMDGERGRSAMGIRKVNSVAKPNYIPRVDKILKGHLLPPPPSYANAPVHIHFNNFTQKKKTDARI